MQRRADVKRKGRVVPRSSGKVRQYAATRRARKLAAFVEHVDPRVVFERDSGICGICELPADPTDWHLDHIVPLSKGGEHSYANAQVSHPSCNARKGSTLSASSTLAA